MRGSHAGPGLSQGWRSCAKWVSELDRTSEAKGTMFQMGKLRLNVEETLRALYHAVIMS